MRTFITILLCFIVSFSVKAQTKIFTEQELIAVVKKFHPVARQALLNMQMADADVTSKRGKFDPVLSTDNGSKTFDGITYYNKSDVALYIPTWYGIDIYAGQDYISGSKINPEDTKGVLNYAGISMSVVQNLMIDKRRAALKQAKIYREASSVERVSILNDLLQDAVKAYWDWWEKYYVSRMLQNSFDNAQKRMMMVKTLYQFGDRPAIDTLEAFTQIQTIAIKQNEMYAELRKSQLELSTFLWKEKDSQFDLPEDAIPQEINANETISIDQLLKAATMHPDLLQYDFKLNALTIEKKLKFQSLLPDVKLKYNRIGPDFSSTVNGALFQNNFRYGISFSMPLLLSEGRGEYRKAGLQIENTRLEQINKSILVNTKVKQSYTDWIQLTSQLGLQEKLVANIIALQRGEETRFANGESSLFLINSREMKTIETQQKLIELQAKKSKSLVKLKWAAGLFN